MVGILDLIHRKLWGYAQKYNLQCMLMVILVAIEMEPAARLATSAAKFELCASSAWCYHFRKKKKTLSFSFLIVLHPTESSQPGIPTGSGKTGAQSIQMSYKCPYLRLTQISAFITGYDKSLHEEQIVRCGTCTQKFTSNICSEEGTLLVVDCSQLAGK